MCPLRTTSCAHIDHYGYGLRPLSDKDVDHYGYGLRPLSDPDVDRCVIVCDDEHTSFHFGLRGRKFVLCLIGECPWHVYVIAGNMHGFYTYLSSLLQTDGEVAFEDIPMFGISQTLSN